MAKTQLNVRIEKEHAETARARAAARNMALGEYVESLIEQEDEDKRAQATEYAKNWMDDWRGFFQEIGDAR